MAARLECPALEFAKPVVATWPSIVQLAQRIDAEIVRTGEVPHDDAVALASLVLLFQAGLTSSTIPGR